MTERPTVEPTKTLLTQGYCQACREEIEVYRYEYESGSLIYQFNHGLCASYYPDELAFLDPDLDKAIGRVVAAYNYGHGAGFRALNQEIEVRKLNAELVAALEGIRNQVTVYPDGNAFSRNQTVKTIDNIAEAAIAKAKT